MCWGLGLRRLAEVRLCVGCGGLVALGFFGVVGEVGDDADQVGVRGVSRTGEFFFP